jgi:hypothetical protein
MIRADENLLSRAEEIEHDGVVEIFDLSLVSFDMDFDRTDSLLLTGLFDYALAMTPRSFRGFSEKDHAGQASRSIILRSPFFRTPGLCRLNDHAYV